MSTPHNVAASVRQKLLNLSKARHEDFDQIVVRYALERLLYRLAQSAHVNHFVLKGALLFRLWFDLQQRPTRDADFLGFGDADPARMVAIFTELAQLKFAEDDGLLFLSETVRAEPIRKAAGYPGIRISLQAKLGVMNIPVQCDIGFGDAITPDASFAQYPSLLDFPSPELRVYPLETVVAEKLEAMVKLGRFNTRLKDYFDLWILMQYEQLNLSLVSEAIVRTFNRRECTIPLAAPIGLSAEFAQEQVALWNAFLRRSKLEAPELTIVVAQLHDFYMPLLCQAATPVENR